MAPIYILGLLFLYTQGIYSAPYEIISAKQDIKAEPGVTVIFNCEFEGSSAPRMVIWMNNSNAMSGNRDLWVENDRVSIVGDSDMEFNLRLTDVGLMDEGEYECQDPASRMEVTHTLTIVIPPTITTSPEEDDVSVIEGEDLTLSCTAEGKPDPTLTWKFRRADNVAEVPLEDGDDVTVNGEDVTFTDVNRHKSGTYICLADNGIGPNSPAREEFDVIVTFAPSVYTVESLVHTGPGDDLELQCIFTSNPPVQIIWSFNGQDLQLDDDTKMADFEKTGEHEMTSTLTLMDLSDDDLGHYTCTGANGKGEASSVVELSGLPWSVQFSSDPQGAYSDSYDLDWTFSSVAIPNQCELKVTHLADNSEFGSNTVPALVSTSFSHNQRYRIEGLERATEYGVQVNCENEFGSTGWSETFAFNTSSEENVAPPPTTTQEPPETTKLSERIDQGEGGETSDGDNGNGASAFTSCTYLILSTAILYFLQ